MATISELMVKLNLDDQQFKNQLISSGNSVKKFADTATSSLKSFLAFASVAAIFTSIGIAVTETERRLSKLNDTAERLGIGISELQSLQYAAQQAGVSTDSLNSSLSKMLATIGRASAGNKQAAAALAQIGLTVQDLINLSPDQQYIKIAEGIRQVGNAAQQAAINQAIFGKGGFENLSIVKEGVKGLIDEYKSLGVALTTDQVKAVEKYGDELSKLSTIWNGFKDQLAAALAGPLKQLLDWIVEIIKGMGGFEQISKKVATGIISAFGAIVEIFDKTKRAMLSLSIASSEFIKLGLKINQIGTLGLSNLFGAGKAIENLQKNINNLSASYKNSEKSSQDFKNRIQEIKDAVNSPVHSNLAGTAFNNPVSPQLTIQKDITEEYTKQLKIAKDAVAEQNKKIQSMKNEQSLLNDLVESRGGELEKFKSQAEQSKKLQEELANLKKQGPTIAVDGSFGPGRSLLDTSKIEDLISKFQDLQNEVKPEDLINARLSEIQQAFEILTNPNNQFGAGNTDRARQVELKVVVEAQEGLEAKIAQSKANKDVILTTVNSQLSAVASGGI